MADAIDVKLWELYKKLPDVNDMSDEALETRGEFAKSLSAFNASNMQQAIHNVNKPEIKRNIDPNNLPPDFLYRKAIPTPDPLRTSLDRYSGTSDLIEGVTSSVKPNVKLDISGELRKQRIESLKAESMTPYEAPADTSTLFGTDPLGAASEFMRGIFKSGFQNLKENFNIGEGEETGRKLYEGLPSVNRGSMADVHFNELFNSADSIDQYEDVNYAANMVVEGTNLGIEMSGLERKLQEKLGPIFGKLVQSGEEARQHPETLYEIPAGATLDFIANMSAFATHYGVPLAVAGNPALQMFVNKDVRDKLGGNEAYAAIEYANKLAQDMNKEIQQGFYQPTSPYLQVFKNGMYSLIPNVVGLGASVATGGSALFALTVLGMSAAGQKCQELKDKGYDDLVSKFVGLGNGLCEIGSEYLPMEKALKLSFGKATWKDVMTAFFFEIAGEEVNQLAENMQNAMFEGYTPADRQEYVDVLWTTAFSSGMLIGSGALINKSRTYKPVAKKAWDKFHSGLNQNLDEGPVSDGFIKRTVQSASDTIKFVKTAVKLMNDTVGDRGSISFEKKKEYKIIVQSMVLDDLVKSRINSSIETGLDFSAPLEEYYEKLFGEKGTRVDLYKHFFGEDFEGIGELFKEYANRYDISEKIKLEKDIIDAYFENSTDTFAAPVGKPYSDYADKLGGTISGQFLVQYARRDGLWSGQREIEIIQQFGNNILVRVGDSFQIVPKNNLSIVRETSADKIYTGKDKQLFDTNPVNETRITSEPDSLFLVVNEDTARKFNNVVSFDSSMTDKNFLSNQLLISNTINNIQRSIIGKTEVPTLSMSQMNDKVVKPLVEDGKAMVYGNGLDVGDIIEINVDGKLEPVYARVVKVDQGARWTWRKGWRTTNSQSGKERYYIEHTSLKREDGFKNIIIPQNIGANLQKNAPITFNFLMNKLAYLKEFHNSRVADSLADQEYIYKKVSPEVVPINMTVYDSQGMAHTTSYKEEYVRNEKSKIIKEVLVLKNGKSVYLTDNGFLDREGNQYIIDHKEVENYTSDFVAIDSSGKFVIATGSSLKEVKDKTSHLKDSEFYISSAKDYLEQLDKEITNRAKINVNNKIEEAKKKFPRIWDMLSNADIMRNIRWFGYTGTKSEKYAGLRGITADEFGIINLNQKFAGTDEYLNTITHETMHVYIGSAILKDPNLLSELRDFKFKLMVNDIWDQYEAKIRLEKGNEWFEKFKEESTKVHEILPYYLINKELIELTENIFDGDHTLYESGLALLEKAIEINNGIRKEAAKGTLYEYKQLVHKEIVANHKPHPKFEKNKYLFGTNFYKAIKDGIKTSMIVMTDSIKDVKVGDLIDVVGGYADGGITLKVKSIDHGIVSMLKKSEVIDDRGRRSNPFAEDISKTEALTDFVPWTPKSKATPNDTPYGKGWIIKGSGASYMFSSSNAGSFWKNKRASRIVFEIAQKNVEPSEAKKREAKDISFEYKREETENERRVRYVYNKLNELISSQKIDEAIKLVNWAVGNDFITQDEADNIIERWEKNSGKPAYRSLFDYALEEDETSKMYIFQLKADKTYAMDSQTATGMGLEGGKGSKGKRLVPFFKGVPFLGTGSYTGTTGTNTGFYEFGITGAEFNSMYSMHLDSVLEELQLYIDTNGLEGLDPKSSLAQVHYQTYPELKDWYDKYSHQSEESKEMMQKLINKSMSTFVDVQMYTESVDEIGEDGLPKYNKREIDPTTLSRSLREAAKNASDEQAAKDSAMVDNVLELSKKMTEFKIDSDDLKNLNNISKKSFIPKAISNFIKRLSTRTGANPEVISDQIKDLKNTEDRIRLDIPDLLKRAEYFNQDPEDYITNIFVGKGLPEVTTDGSISARGYARMLMRDILNDEMTKIIENDVEDFIYNEAMKRTDEYGFSQKINDQIYKMKQRRIEKAKKFADNAIEFIKDLSFFPNTPEEFKLRMEELIAAIKDLGVKSGKIEDSIWYNINNFGHRAMITEIIALEDELKRSRQEFMTFPGSVTGRPWNPNMVGDKTGYNLNPLKEFEANMSGEKFAGSSIVSSIKSGEATFSKSRNKKATLELRGMCLEVGLSESQTDLMLQDKDRTPQIANQILGIKYIDGIAKANNLVVKIQANGEKYLEHVVGHPLVQPVHITNTVSVESATKIIKDEIESQLRNIRKYNKKYYENMIILHRNERDIGAVGRNYEKILEEYNSAMKKFNSLPQAIQKNLLNVRNTWRMWTSHQLAVLKNLGWIEPNAGWDSYAPYFVNADWSMKRWMGLPKKLKEQPAFYTEKAYGTIRERILEPQFLVDHILNVKYDILLSQQIDKIGRQFDMSHFLDEKEIEKLYHYDSKGNLHDYAKAGVKFTLQEDRVDADGKVVMKAGNYIFWTPEFYKFSIGTIETGETVILDYTKSYLLEENIAKALNGLALPYNAVMENINKAVNIWKRTIIYAIFPSFNYNNMFGDMQMFMSLHPEASRAIQYLPQAVKFLTKYAYYLKGSEKEGSVRKVLNAMIDPGFTPFENKVKAFIETYSVIEAGEMRADLGRTDVTNIIKYMSSKLANTAMWREAILRTTNAFYIVAEEDSGNIQKLRKSFGFLGIDQTLGDMDYLGRVSKVLMIDYFRRSPTYQRWVTGLAAPWGHFYIQGSKNFAKWLTGYGLPFHKKIAMFMKRTTLLSIPYALANIFNYGLFYMLLGDRDKAKKMYEIELSLTPELRNRFHINIGWKSGRLYVWTPQMLPDLLLGTKFIGVFNNQIFRMMSGEIGPKQAVKISLKDWAKAEGKSGLFLLNPLVRFFTGIWTRTDPLDGTPIYPGFDYAKLTTNEKLGWMALYFNKVCNPLLSTYVTEYQKSGMNHTDSLFEAFKKFGHYQAILGIKESGRKIMNVQPTGRENKLLEEPGKRNITREVDEKKRDLIATEASYLRDIESDWTRSRKSPIDFMNSDSTKKLLKNMYKDVYNNTISDAQWASLQKRVGNIFSDPESNIKWADNCMRHLKPGTKEYKQMEDFKLNVQIWVKQKGKGIPLTIRGEMREIVDDTIEKEE